jgi:serine phosphatase RsbU (regulator of sigma subunit)
MDSLLQVANDRSRPDADRYAAWFALVDLSHDDLVPALAFLYDAEKLAVLTKNDTMHFTITDRMYYLNLGHGRMVPAFTLTQKLMDMAEAMHDTVRLAHTHFLIGNIFRTLDLYEKAAESEKTALALYMRTSAEHEITWHTYLLGFYQFNAGKYEDALINFKEAFKRYQLKEDSPGDLAETSGWIGNSYAGMKDFENAIRWRNKSLDYAIQTRNDFTMGDAYRYLGNLYRKMNEPDSALANLNKSFALFVKAGSAERSGLVLYFIAEQYAALHNYAKAAETLDRILSDKAGGYSRILDVNLMAAKLAGTVYAKVDQPERSARYLNQYLTLSESLKTAQNADKLAEEKMKYEFQREQQHEKLAQELKDESTARYMSRQNIIRNAILTGLFLCIVMAVIVYRGYRQKTRINRELALQKLITEQKNKDITDSINYAQKIQEATLPAKEIKFRVFPEAFVLFKPRDIVSGDFYWFAEKDGKRIIAAIDCTGHGVPGALMSMMGNAFLNEIINQRGITQPAQILGELRDLVIGTLKQQSAEGNTREGMDMAILAFDDKAGTVEYAGANNPLWIVRRDGSDALVQEYVPDKRPIGYFKGQGLPFKNHVIKVQKDDMFYIFTDGYADQFGGPKGKKFKYKQLQKLLLSIFSSSMPDQEKQLAEAFETWKGDLDQVDDVLLIGVRA